LCGVPAKFKSAWHYAGGGRGVFGRAWIGRAAADARRQGDVSGAEEGRDGGRGVGAHQPIGGAMADDAYFCETDEVAQEALPFRIEAGFAQEVVFPMNAPNFSSMIGFRYWLFRE
jgi:hypothetical protein